MKERNFKGFDDNERSLYIGDIVAFSVNVLNIMKRASGISQECTPNKMHYANVLYVYTEKGLVCLCHGYLNNINIYNSQLMLSKKKDNSISYRKYKLFKFFILQKKLQEILKDA